MAAFSLGANVFVNCCYDYADDVAKIVAGAVVVGSPWDLVKSSKSKSFVVRAVLVFIPFVWSELENKLSLSHWLYAKPFADSLDEYARKNWSSILKMKNAKHIDEGYKKNKKSVSVYHFDTLVTAPLGAYKDVSEYYKDSSTHTKLDRCRVPLLCVSSMDDPIVDGNSMPTFHCNNPNVGFVLCHTGGHLGFTEWRWDWRTSSYVDSVCSSFFHQILVQNKEQ